MGLRLWQSSGFNLTMGRRAPLKGNLGVALLTALLPLIAVWTYMQMSRSVSAAEAAQAVPPPTASEASVLEPPQFRSEVWFLPDEEFHGFVEILAGPFLMGSDPSVDTLAFDSERWAPGQVQGAVYLPTFYIGRYEVTVAQFRAFVEATGFRVDDQMLDLPPNHPVAFVSWPDALAYSRWLEAMLREGPETSPQLRQLLVDGWRVSLPSEAEWEKAARGMDGRIFPWGDEFTPERANYAGSGTIPVGSFDCSECSFGLSDMSGNVWEWTRSPYQPYPYDETDDREGLETDALWVMRGGGFGDTEQNVRSAVRGGADPGVRRGFIGFRIVISRF